MLRNFQQNVTTFSKYAPSAIAKAELSACVDWQPDALYFYTPHLFTHNWRGSQLFTIQNIIPVVIWKLRPDQSIVLPLTTFGFMAKSSQSLIPAISVGRLDSSAFTLSLIKRERLEWSLTDRQECFLYLLRSHRLYRSPQARTTRQISLPTTFIACRLVSLSSIVPDRLWTYHRDGTTFKPSNKQNTRLIPYLYTGLWYIIFLTGSWFTWVKTGWFGSLSR